MRFKQTLALSLSLFLLTSCASASKTATINKESYPIYFLTDESGNIIYDEDNLPLTPLNTYVSITTTNDEFRDAMDKDFEDLIRKYHYLLDSHHNFEGVNNIKTINDNYGIGPVEVDEDIIEILEEAIEISKLSDGYFNPTIGALSDVWSGKYGTEVQSDPDITEIEKAKACVISNDKLEEYIEIDKDNNTVYLKEYDGCSGSVKISLGAISKGYALDKIAEELKKYDSGFLLSAGGSSTLTYVADDQMKDLFWKIGIVDPDQTDQSYSIIQVQNSAISTSGDYQQYFINEEGIRRHHILNPFTGYPENLYRSITLINNDNGTILDALSTSLFSTEDLEKYIDVFDNNYSTDIKAYVLTDNHGQATVSYSTVDNLLVK